MLSRRGTPVHLVDLDPQASLTRAFGIEDDADGFYNALTDRAGLPMKTVAQNLTIVSRQLRTQPGGNRTPERTGTGALSSHQP